MADIQKYLDDIKSAVYGEEVRGSIHDAIKAIDEEVYTGVEDAERLLETMQSINTSVQGNASRAWTYADDASTAANEAIKARDTAVSNANTASTAANEAKTSAGAAEYYSGFASGYALMSQSYAVGGTGKRDGEDQDNAKYYADQAKRAASSVSGALSAQRTITFEELATVKPEPGWMYNISNDFETDSRFMEGEGVKYAKGTNVYWTTSSKWDCLAAPDYVRSISVNGTEVSPDNGGNVNIEAYNSTNKPEVGGRNLLLGTRDFSGDNWGNTDGWQSDGTYNGLSVMTRNAPWTGIYQEVYAKAGEIYTFSAYVKCSFSTDAPDVGIYLISSGGSGGENILPLHFHNITVDKEFKRYSYTFKVIKDISICPRIEMGTPKSDSDAISVCGLKLERGEIATDWSPAPEDLEAEIEGIEIGGRNLLLNSGVMVTNSEYMIAKYRITEQLKTGDKVTVSIKGKLGEGKEYFHIFNSGGNYGFDENAWLRPDKQGYAVGTFDWHEYGANNFIYVYIKPKNDAATVESSIEWIKLERGNKATDWSPAPEDLETTADNFEGVLPVEKGGTGSSIGPKFILDQSPELAEGRVIQIYMDYAGDPRNRFAAATKKYIVCSYNYKGKIYYGSVWITDFKKILEIIPATSTTAGLVKPGTGLSVTDDGTLNVTGGSGGGGGSIYCHNILINFDNMASSTGGHSGTCNGTLMTVIYDSNPNAYNSVSSVAKFIYDNWPRDKMYFASGGINETSSSNPSYCGSVYSIGSSSDGSKLSVYGYCMCKIENSVVTAGIKRTDSLSCTLTDSESVMITDTPVLI